jgi:tetratricopeptide (TPR) repeat protein
VGIIVVAMTAKLSGWLRQAPATVPALVAIAVFAVWATSQAGFPLTHWAPGGLVVLVLLVMAAGLLRPALAEMPLSVRVALGALAAYTALSFLSILWAAVPGEAWEGADRTLLYLLIFALFACWRQHGAGAALLLCLWVLALVAIALVDALHINAAGGSSLQAMLPGGRLEYPTGYPNSNAAQWLMAFWPAVLLARSERLPWALRGLLAGGAVLLAEVALLSQSRGSVYAMPVLAVLVFALLPGRTRTFAVLIAVGGGVAAAAPAVLRVGGHLDHGAVVAGNVHKAIEASLIAAVVVAAIVAVAGAIEGRLALPDASRTRVRRGVGALAIVVLLIAIVGGVAATGSPVTRVEHGWESFKAGYAGSATGSHLSSGLGSNRYDFYRVALDEFVSHPVVGIGADNFEQQYLALGRSDETPHYPHSIELRTLTETGLLGALLALIGLAGALVAAAQAIRSSRDPLAGTVAAAALSGFAYWVLHGSFDWFWEFAGLGGPAFALLGLTCALAPARVRAEREAEDVPTRRSPVLRGVLLACAALATLAIAVSLAAPWLSQLQVHKAARIWTTSPKSAYERLNTAAKLNPLSDEAYLVAGSIALRFGETAHADREFALALSRTPGDAYATLERGAIASAAGRPAEALELLRRAVALAPRDELAREALKLVRAGREVNLKVLNRLILLKAQQLV